MELSFIQKGANVFAGEKLYLDWGLSPLHNLLKHKFGYTLAVDGDFGSMTESAVIAFQKSKNLAVDGMVGPQTWLGLLSHAK